VPDGFHITTSAYRKVVEENHLFPVILASSENVDIHKPGTLEKAAQGIHELFAQCQIPAEIVEEITLAYSRLPGQLAAVAVRSSATAEDLPRPPLPGTGDLSKRSWR